MFLADRMHLANAVARSRVGPAMVAAVLALLLLAAIGGRAHAGETAPSVAESTQAAASASDSNDASQTLDRNLLVLRVWLAGAALCVLVFGHALARSGRTQRWIRSRRVALGLLAALSFGANYNFFLSTGIHKHEFFHYYLGAKYAPELGYYEIYRCSIAASIEQRFVDRNPLFRVTDLHSNDLRCTDHPARRAATAPSRPRAGRRSRTTSPASGRSWDPSGNGCCKTMATTRHRSGP
jgi:hypothetical protein